MISQIHRFHGRASIQRLYKNGKLVRSAEMSLRFAPNPKRADYRLAVVVGKKVSKSAVVRNRIRRRIYEHVRMMFGPTPIPYDLLITVFDERMATLPTADVTYGVNGLIKKANIA